MPMPTPEQIEEYRRQAKRPKTTYPLPAGLEAYRHRIDALMEALPCTEDQGIQALDRTSPVVAYGPETYIIDDTTRLLGYVLHARLITWDPKANGGYGMISRAETNG